MQDRVPIYPGRVRLTPVSGQENTYDMVRADSPTQEGTPLNKATLLKDATAAMFGLGSEAVPDDVLAFIGKYAQHWWRRRKATPVYRYDKVVTEQPQTTISELASSVPSAKLVVNRDANTGSNAVNRNFYYSSSITIDQSTGEVKLVNPTSMYFKVGYSNGFGETEGNYFTNIYENPTAVYKGAGKASNGTQKVGGFYYQYLKSNVEVITSKKVFDHYTDLGDWEYVTSISKETYPENGYLNGYVYEYIGVPFDNSVNAVKIETGSYMGTGTYGSSNPCSLTFDFSPILVYIVRKDISGNGYVDAMAKFYSICMDETYPGNSSNSNYYYQSVSANGGEAKLANNTLTWYASSAAKQMNALDSSYEYRYVAIGL